MAEILEFRPRPQSTGRVVCDPVTAVMVTHANADRQAAAAAANSVAGKARSGINAVDRKLSELRDGIVDARSRLRESCGGRVHVPPLSAWAVFAIYAVGFIAELAIADGLLDFAFLQGRPSDAPNFLAHFEGAGIFEGLVYALTDYSTQKAWASVGIAAYTFACAKANGTWVRQRAAGRPDVPAWGVVVWNAVFLLASAGYVALRYAAMSHEEASADFAHLAPVFLVIQLMFYVGASFLAAWLADPDPEATRLAKVDARLTSRFEKLVERRAALSAPVAGAISAARNRCDQIAATALWNIASYRAGNLSSRPVGEPVPDFLTSAVGEGVFEPVLLDPPPDPPAGLLDDVLRRKTG